MYDMNSPLRLEYPDAWERKKVAALHVGFKVDKKGMFDKSVETALIGENNYVNLAMTKYVMLHGIPEYSALVAYQTGLGFEVLKTLRGTINPTITKNIESLRIKIKEDYVIEVINKDNFCFTEDTILCRAFTLGELVRELPECRIEKFTDKLGVVFTAQIVMHPLIYESRISPEEAAGELYYEILKSKL